MIKFIKNIFIKSLFYVSLLFSAPDSNLSCDPFTLSYIKANEATAILHGMGYSVVEFDKIDSLNYYIPNNEMLSFPAIISFPLTEVGYLDNFSGDNSGSYDSESSQTSYLSGSVFKKLLSSSPMEQLLICYESNNPSPYYNLLEYIKNTLDIAAKQIMIDAMIIEINSSDLEEFEFSFDDTSSTNIVSEINNLSFSIGQNGVYTEAGKTIQEQINLKISAIMRNSSAEILSKPSVLVLDGRQARIQVGEQIPISKLPLTNAQDLFVVPDVEYLPVGITLNIRPRISDDNKQITMQVETIITEVDTEYSSSDGTIIDAPIINNRKVESFVRLANNTPFIVGGLISNKQARGKGRIPLLSKIPIIGNIFKSNSVSSQNREVIVVLTPHVIEDNNSHFSKVIPQDSEKFNSFGSILFSNSYRLKDSDIYDLDFIVNSNPVKSLRESIGKLSKEVINNDEIARSISNGHIPGESIIVRRMIYEIVKRSEYYSHINSENVIFFSKDAGIHKLKDSDDIYLKDDSKSVLLKLEENNLNSSFNRPYVSSKNIDVGDRYIDSLRFHNSETNAIILSNKKHRRLLLESIILKHLLKMNPDLSLDIDSFKRGLEIQFPNPAVFEDNMQLVDPEVMSFFYEINDYYYAFEKEFNRIYERYAN